MDHVERTPRAEPTRSPLPRARARARARLAAHRKNAAATRSHSGWWCGSQARARKRASVDPGGELAAEEHYRSARPASNPTSKAATAMRMTTLVLVPVDTR